MENSNFEIFADDKKTEMKTAAEIAAETFKLNLQRSCDAVRSRPNLELERDKLEIAGMSADYLLKEPMPGVNLVQTELRHKMMDATNIVIAEACYQVNVDPDVLAKQAELIADLREALDVLGQQVIGSQFTEYMNLLEENARLRETIRMLGGNDCNEQFT